MLLSLIKNKDIAEKSAQESWGEAMQCQLTGNLAADYDSILLYNEKFTYSTLWNETWL